MSYGSTFMQFEANGRISNKFSRQSVRRESFASERDAPKVVHYEKQFDVNLTRVTSSPPDKASVRDSMLAYSKKMKSIQDARHGTGNAKGDALFVRAKHIPKYPNKPPKKRRPMSFDELLGRDRDQPLDRSNVTRQRPLSEKLPPVKERKEDHSVTLPPISERLRKTSNSVQLSLVSASDLYDIVDFSLRSKGTRNDSLRLLELEKHESEIRSSRLDHQKDVIVVPDIGYNRFEQSTESRRHDERRQYMRIIEDHTYPDSQVPSKEFYQEMFALDKTEPSIVKQNKSSIVSINPIKRRPQRAKRMRLLDPGLGDIPEDNIIETNISVFQSKRETSRAVSPAPVKRQSPKPYAQFHQLDSISEITEKGTTRNIRNNPDIVLPNQSAETHVSDISALPSHRSDAEEPNILPPIFTVKSTTTKVIKDDGDVRIEVTQCPPKSENDFNMKLKAQKRFRKLIFLRDGNR
ncbi:uncharacterized protein LOC127877529 [Dreissena polymorpha]|uniref:Uncharacterized protein n=1 Tax=Dreissena polymorpha TaxID=45954 RepID=A0A9D4K7T4_DREPO|nr:uncharacterized protein LOC127877529 [Dreissena polymorpha]XP_052279437.1 uncharacterized protein LOC127877529 [Dreissena polymorpha]XP_052279438.1 uncharacterized protein LOC127877529 [Dreissena polymorpha]XP_052279439.1 uncharacterized protein LOC127877529 [Dreissena polymorpha]KAH3834549.1 hypothetical protein DPMN_107879 [Dreissena polymorpha]